MMKSTTGPTSKRPASPSTSDMSSRRAFCFFLVKGIFIVLLALTLHLSPLYRYNQNTYFLHGFAKAGLGGLGADWLAQTTDPFPVFSALISFTVSVFNEEFFYLYQIFLYCVFAYSVLGIGSQLFRFSFFSLSYLAYYTSLIALFSGFLGSLFEKWTVTGRLAPVFAGNGPLISGVAGQYILGSYLQPSEFGVFILLSMYMFLRRNSLIAIVCLLIATTFHSTYLLSAAILTGTYVSIIYFGDGNRQKALLLAAGALVLVMPNFLYSAINFGPTTAESFAEAQRILVDIRIPHHAKFVHWKRKYLPLQLALLSYSLILVRNSRLFLVLLLPFLTALTMTIIQLQTGSTSLAMLFPWRVSVFLIPLASSLFLAHMIFWMRKSHTGIVNAYRGFGNLPIVARILQLESKLSQLVMKKFTNRDNRIQLIPIAVKLALLYCIAGFAYTGVEETITTFKARRQGQSARTQFALQAYRPGHLYLIPPLYDTFRLAAKVPIFIDFKSHPYKDTEVIEWYKRYEIAHDFYNLKQYQSCPGVNEIFRDFGITHLVLEQKSVSNHCDDLQEIYRDKEYSIFTLKEQA